MNTRRFSRALLVGAALTFGAVPVAQTALGQPILNMSAAARALAARIASDLTTLSSQGKTATDIVSSLAETIRDDMVTGDVKPAEAVQAILDATADSATSFTSPLLVALADGLQDKGYDSSVRAVLAATIVLASPGTIDSVCSTFNRELCEGIRAELGEDEPTAAAGSTLGTAAGRIVKQGGALLSQPSEAGSVE